MYFVAVPVPTQTYTKLVDYLRIHQPHKDPTAAVLEAIEQMIGLAPRAATKAGPANANAAAEAGKGYVWKQLFLPNGSMLKTTYKKKQYIATVVGDALLYNKESTSPNQFLMTVRGAPVNTWTHIYVKRPQDADWMRADDLRVKKAA